MSKIHIIINNDSYEDEPKTYHLYKQRGSFYSSKVYDSFTKINIRHDVLYVINCYNLKAIEQINDENIFINSNLSNPIQELLIISGIINFENSKDILKTSSEYKISENNPLKIWFRDLKNYISNTGKSIFEFLSIPYLNENVVINVLTSKFNLGIARSRDRAIKFINNNRDKFNNITHVLMLDDSDFVGFKTKFTELDKNKMYKQRLFVNGKISNISSSSAARASYWQYLIPINKIFEYYSLLADLSEDVITLKYTEPIKYRDCFVDYSSSKSGDPKDKSTKMNLHFNPPIIYIDNGKLVSFDTNGSKILLTDEMLRIIFPKLIFIFKDNYKTHVILPKTDLESIYTKFKIENKKENLTIFDENINSFIEYYYTNPGSVMIDKCINDIKKYFNTDCKKYIIVKNSIKTDSLKMYEVKDVNENIINKYKIDCDIYENGTKTTTVLNITQLNFDYEYNEKIKNIIEHIFSNKEIDIVKLKFKEPKITGGNKTIYMKNNLLFVLISLIIVIIIIVIKNYSYSKSKSIYPIQRSISL